VIDPAALGWDDVRAFLEVARRGTLPEAARSLRISTATAGRRVQRLEAALGASLFERLPNRLALTPLGEELAEVGTAMRQGAAALAQRATAWAAPADAPVRVTATGSVSLFLAARARRLADLAEGVTVSVLTTKAALDVAGGEAEIALRMRRLPEDGPLAGRKLGRVAFAVYAARDLWEELGRPESWRDLGVVGLPETARTPSQSRWLDTVAERHGAVVRLRFGEVALRHRAVQEGAGASCCPTFWATATQSWCACSTRRLSWSKTCICCSTSADAERARCRPWRTRSASYSKARLMPCPELTPPLYPMPETARCPC